MLFRSKAYIIGKTAEREAADGRQDGDKNGWQSRGTIKRKTDGIGFGRSLGGGMVGGRRELSRLGMYAIF